MICRSCNAQRCEFIPDKNYPLHVACPSCDEGGCENCDGEGWVEITQCPQNEIGRDVSSFLSLADMAKNGAMPTEGGTLKQTSSFIAACRYLWAEEAKVEADQWRK